MALVLTRNWLSVTPQRLCCSCWAIVGQPLSPLSPPSSPPAQERTDRPGQVAPAVEAATKKWLSWITLSSKQQHVSFWEFCTKVGKVEGYVTARYKYSFYHIAHTQQLYFLIFFTQKGTIQSFLISTELIGIDVAEMFSAVRGYYSELEYVFEMCYPSSLLWSINISIMFKNPHSKSEICGKFKVEGDVCGHF